MSITVANAPVSYGVFELSPEEGVDLPGAEDLAQMVATAGYAGIDSGPIGMLGRGPDLRDRLVRHGLGLAGGWVDLPFAEPAAFERALPDYRQALAFFAQGAAINADLGLPPPRPTLACAGSDERRANPGGGPMLDGPGWRSFAANVQQAQDIAAEHGLRPTFHHHACTYVETPAEIDELLERTTIGLTFDTGHLILGGGDPVTGLQRWAGRIDHLHIKDARRQVLEQVVAEGAGMRQVWGRRAFVALEQGDLDTGGVMDTIIASDYTGWLVVEQDVLPTPADDPDRTQSDQIHNREVLRRWLP